MKIYKYEVLIKDAFSIYLPIGSKILSFQIQNGKPYIWALVDENNESKKRYFVLIGTGNNIDEYNTEILKYIGTIQLDSFVWHLFEDLT